MKSKTTYVWIDNVLHCIFSEHNPVHCKENVKFSVISVDYFEEALLMEKYFSFLFSLDPKVKLKYYRQQNNIYI